jgi:hypothetical protein
VPDAHAASSSTRTAWWSCLVLIAICLAVGLQTVRGDNYFLGDDFGLVHHLHDLPAARLLTYFVSDWTEGAYGMVLDELRPFLAFSYWLDAHLFGAANAAGYHATNVLLHLLNALLVLAIARSIAPREPLFAVFAASFFALMPSHAEPIAWISGRVDSLVSIFYLGAFLCFVRFRVAHRRRWLLAALVVFACGLFAKQSMVTLPVLIFAVDWLWFRSQDPGGRAESRVWPHVPFFVLAASYLALRYTLFGNAVREELLSADIIQEFILRQHRYARELMPTPNWAPQAMRTTAEVLTVGILAACAYWAFIQRRASAQTIRRLWFFGPVWYLVTIAPMIVTYVSARHLYITAAGFSIAAATLVLPAYPDEDRLRRKTRAAMAGTLLVLYAVASIWDVSAWVARGRDSQRLAAAIPRLLQTVPRGSVVVVNVPDRNRDGWFWSWSTPFALGPPFTDQDLNATFRIVERPEIYCCPPDQWWSARKATVAALLESPTPQEVTYITFVPEGEPRFSRRTVDGRALKARLDAAQDKPIDTSPGGAMPDENAVIRVLLEQQ